MLRICHLKNKNTKIHNLFNALFYYMWKDFKGSFLKLDTKPYTVRSAACARRSLINTRRTKQCCKYIKSPLQYLPKNNERKTFYIK